MKINSRRSTAMIALVASWAVSLLSSNVSGQTQVEGKAVVRFASGGVSYSSKGGPFRPLRVNTILTTGDTIKTEDNSRVDLFLGRNNGAVQMAPNSLLALERLTFSTAGEETIHDTELNLQQGRIYGRVSKMSPQSRYEVKTPRFVAGIRGTEYTISTDGVVTVTEGTVLVVVVMPDGTLKTFQVNAGSSFDVKAAVGQEVRPATPDETRQVNTQIQDMLQNAPDANLTPIIFTTPEAPKKPNDPPAGSTGTGGTGGEKNPPPSQSD